MESNRPYPVTVAYLIAVGWACVAFFIWFNPPCPECIDEKCPDQDSVLTGVFFNFDTGELSNGSMYLDEGILDPDPITGESLLWTVDDYEAEIQRRIDEFESQKSGWGQDKIKI